MKKTSLIIPLILLGVAALCMVAIGAIPAQEIPAQDMPVQETPQNIPVEPIARNVTEHEPRYTNNLIIFYDAEIGKDALLQAVQEYDAKILYEYRTMNGIAISLPNGKMIDDAIIYFQDVKGVLVVNRDEIMQLH